MTEAADAGIVDEEVQPAEALDGRINQPAPIALGTDVSGQDQRLAAAPGQGMGDFLQFPRRPGRQHDAGAAPDGLLGQTSANTAGSAGNQNAPVRQLPGHGIAPSTLATIYQIPQPF